MFSIDFYSFNTLHKIFPFKEIKYGACKAGRIELLKQNEELVLLG